jgi:hypothetical protein
MRKTMERMSGVVAVAALAALLAAGCGGDSVNRPDTDVDLLYEQTFTGLQDGIMPVGWTPITQQAATLEGPAEWKIMSARFHQASNVRAPNGAGISYAPDYEGTLAVSGDTSWVNIRYRVDLIPHDDDGIGIVFRWSENAGDPDGDFFRLLMVDDTAAGGPRLRLDKRVDGVWTIIEEDDDYKGYQEGRRYVIEVDMVASDFTIRIDGAIVFEFTDNDPALQSGKIGLFCFAEQGADFDNIRVWRRGP